MGIETIPIFPTSITLTIDLILVAASFLTSALTASFGIGGGVALLALMGTFVPVASLIPVHGLVQLGSNSGRAWHQRTHILWATLLPFLLGAALGAMVGATIVVQLPDRPLKLGLGLFILLVTWLKLPSLGTMGRTGIGIAGCIVAFLSMIFGATGPLSAAFFEKVYSDRQEMVATNAAAMVLIHSLKVVAFALTGFAFRDWLGLILAMIASGYFGTTIGTRILRHIPEQHFRTGFKIVLTLLALDLIRAGLF